MSTSKEKCLSSLELAAMMVGESPTKAQYDTTGISPTSRTIVRVMGGWNAAKEAAGLETYEPGSDGGIPVQPKPDGVEIPEGAHWEDLNPQQRWYYRNREKRIAVKTRRKEELKRWFYEFKRDECSCNRCGEEHPSCLDFHHTGEKNQGVAEMVNLGHSKASILAEIERCVVLCANCHRKEHYEPPDDSE